MVKRNMKESNRNTHRRSLREDLQDGLQILAGKGWVMMSEDSYEDGELGTVGEWDIDVRGKYKSIKDFIKAVNRIQPLEDTNDIGAWAFDSYNGELTTDVLTDDDCVPASPDEIEQWKREEIKLYNCRIAVPAKIISERDITEDDAKALGIEFI